MATILITGGTGLIGKPLARTLADKGYDVIILTRDASRPSDHPRIRFAKWDVEAGQIDRDALRSADHLIHLAGAGVAEKRWTKKRKQEILESRTRGGDLLVKALRENDHQVKSFTSSSAIGWYGPDPAIPNPQPFTETDAADAGFLGRVCVAWERSVAPVAAMGIRLVTFRTGIVLSMEGGALKEFAKPLKAGVASILGSGRQVISWIHIDDMVRLYVESVENQALTGVYNAVAPKPVSNKHLVLKLAEIQRKKFYIPMHVPAFALKLALGQMSVEVLKSATVSCDKLHIANFTFLYPSIESALMHV